MNILYLTSHILDADFASLKGEKKPNPAGQNFHGKVIRALGEEDQVHVYSLLSSLTAGLEEKNFQEEEHISYSYIRGPKNRYLRALCLPGSLSKHIAKANKEHQDNIVIYDSLSATLGLIAKKLSKKLHCPRVAILTDEINNITGVDPKISERIHRIVKESDASIALTEGLVRSYELHDKPSYIQPIFVEEVPITPVERERPYIYYGGALFVKDGTEDLLEAYPRFSKDYDLIISGHGPMEKEVQEAADKEKGILFLGQISKEEHYAYIAGSAIAVNPRHYNPGLDATAVPSKVMEYLTYGKVVVSSLSTPIQKEFGKDIHWITSDLEEFLNTHELSKLTPSNAKEKILSLYGRESSGKALHGFLISLNGR